MRSWCYTLSLVLFALLAIGPAPASSSAIEMADRVVVHKSQRRLRLMRGDRVLREFGVALGLTPTGPKRQEGDFRTPEGEYRLSGRNANSDFFLAIQVDYPGPDDERRRNDHDSWPAQPAFPAA